MFRWLLFFPSVTFGLLQSEIFPWALIYVGWRGKFWNKNLVPVFVLFIFSFVLVTIFHGLQFESFRAILAYLNPLLLFFCLLQSDQQEIKKMRRAIGITLGFMLFLGLLQFLDLLGPLGEFLSWLTPRASHKALGAGRGVTLMSSEPSRAASELIFLYGVWRTFKKVTQKQLLLCDFLFSMLVLGLIRSASGLALLVVLFSFSYGSRFFLLCLFAAIPAYFFLKASRAVVVALNALKSESWAELYLFLIDASGFRLVSLVSAYLAGLTKLFGYGVGLWESSSIDAMREAGFDPGSVSYFVDMTDSNFSSFRPNSYFSNAALDFGLVGLIIIGRLIYPYTKMFIGTDPSRKAVLALFLFTFAFDGSVGNPIPWICFAVAIRNIENADFISPLANKTASVNKNLYSRRNS